MTITEERSEVETVSAAAEPVPSGIESLLSVGDHKPIGRYWISVGSLFLVVSLALTVIASFEAVDLGSMSFLENTDEYVQVGSLAQELLLFGALIPILVGIGIYIVPLQVGAASLAYPRGAAGAFWTWLVGCSLLIVSYVANGGAGGGRTDFIELWVLSLGIVIGSIIWALVCIATTVMGVRAAGMTMSRVPATSWSFLVFSLLGILILPVTLAELVITYARFSAGFVQLGDTQALANVLRGVQSAPTVFWVAVPALGILVDAISTSSGSPVKFHRVVLGAVGLAGIASFGVNVVGFGTVREPSYDNLLFVLDTGLIVLPILAIVGLLLVKIKPDANTRRSVTPFAGLISGLFLLAASGAALLGTVKPVAVGLEELGFLEPTRILVVNGTTFDQGIRAAVFGSILLALIAGLNHWSIKIWGRYLNQPFLSLATLAAAGGTALWSVGNIAAGIDDQKAFPATEPTGGSQVELFSQVAALGAVAVLGAAALLFISVVQQPKAEAAVPKDQLRWVGFTLEWMTESPPAVGNFTVPPLVSSANPVSDAIAINEGAEE